MVVAYINELVAEKFIKEQRQIIDHFCRKKQLKVDKWVNSPDAKLLEEKDLLLCSEISYLSCNLLNVLMILKECFNKNIKIYSISDRFVFEKTMGGELMEKVFNEVFKLGNSMLSRRTKNVMERRKKENLPVGRPQGSMVKQSLLKENAEKVEEMLNKGLSVTEVCDKFNVSRNTYYLYKRSLKK